MDDADSSICSVVTFLRSFCNVNKSGNSSLTCSASVGSPSYNDSNFCSKDLSRNSFTDKIVFATARFVAGADAIILGVIVPMSGSTVVGFDAEDDDLDPVFFELVAAVEAGVTTSSIMSKSGSSLVLLVP